MGSKKYKGQIDVLADSTTSQLARVLRAQGVGGRQFAIFFILQKWKSQILFT